MLLYFERYGRIVESEKSWGVVTALIRSHYDVWEDIVSGSQ